MNKNQDEIKSQNPKPVKKLKPLKPTGTSAKPEDVKEKTTKKRIVINYDAINESPEVPAEEPVKKENKKSDTKKSENKKPNNKKTNNKKPNKKSFFESMKDMMYASADDDDEEEQETESGDIPEENNDENNFTVEPVEEDTTADTLENISEVLAEINDELPAEESEEKSEPEKENTPEQVKTPEKKNNNNNNNNNRKKKNKKKKKSQQKNNSAENKKPEVKPEEKTAEPEKIPEETEPETKPAEESQPATEPETTETETEVKNTTEIPEEVKAADIPAHSGKYNILALVCIILAIIGVIAIVNTCISGGGSSGDKYRKAVYPAVIADISPFENPSELTDNQILSSAIWSVVIDSEKLSAYPQVVNNMAIIPAEDIESAAREMFGEDIPELAHSTIVTADSKFYYNAEANSYSVEISPHMFTYSPEVLSVSRKSGKYIVEVNYIDQHPEWQEDTISKTVEYSLSKNGNGGYIIESMHEVTAE